MYLSAKSIVLAGLMVTGSAMADDAVKALCGKTVDECQKKVDGLTAQLTNMTIMYQAARQQRINVQAAADDAAVMQYAKERQK